MIQIGTEGGFLLQEVTHVSPKPMQFDPDTGNPVSNSLLLAPAERADLIIDFTGLAGKHFIMYGDAPGPFPGGGPETDYFLGNPGNPIQPKPGYGPDTRQLLRIKVVAGASDPQPAGPILDPARIDPPLLSSPPSGWTPAQPLARPAGASVRDLSLNETFDGYGRLTQLLGTMTPGPSGELGREYLETATEVVAPGSTEVWRIWNLTADTHPIHFHLVNVQVLSRQPFQIDPSGAPVLDPGTGLPLLVGNARGPELNEMGWKETVQMHPAEVIEVAMKFDLPGALPFNVPSSPRAEALMGGPVPHHKKYHEFVWHCHILEHEEHDMMRPLVVEENLPE